MLIAIDARTMGDKPSGIGMYLYNFLKQMIKYEAFEFVLITDVARSEYINYFLKHGIEVRVYGKPFYNSAEVYKYFRYLKRELDHIKPDLFWEVNNLIPIRLKGNYKVMTTVHDIFPIQHPEYFGFVYSTYFRYALKMTLKHSDILLYDSALTKKATEDFSAYASKKPSCVTYIISERMAKQNECTDEGYFLYVGNIERRKGVDLLLKAYELYVSRGGTKDLVLAGKLIDKELAELLNKVKNTTDRVTYLSYVDSADKQKLYAACSCFVFPSKAEGFGMPVLELMDVGKPVLVSNLEIFDELEGDSINRFDISGSSDEQIESLARAMSEYNKEVDVEGYEKVLSRYTPDLLGNNLREFIVSQMQSEYKEV